MNLVDIVVGNTGTQVVAAINGNNDLIEVAASRGASLVGKKLVTLGDSITNAQLWQPAIVALTGLIWSANETSSGVDGHKAMSRNSSKLSADRTEGWEPESIYSVADDVHYYSPDIIIVMGGVNDNINFLGIQSDVSEAPYTGPEVFSPDVPPSFISSFKGLLLKLTSQNPTAKVFVTSIPYSFNGTRTEAEKLAHISCRDGFKKMCEYYGAVLIDVFGECGFNDQNHDTYYTLTSNGVHPNEAGGIKLGQYIASKLY